MKQADVTLIEPNKLKRNPDNPRLIFHADDMLALQQSIAEQGILVPLTVYEDGSAYRLLDGERRWRCAIKLGMRKVPVIVQRKPERIANIMMMFAIHNARKDWDPLPTALKLEELEAEFEKRNGRRPTEKQLAGLASLSRGEVRRLKQLLALPLEYREELLRELEKPRAQQKVTVDHVLEARNAAASLRTRAIVDEAGEEQLRRALVNKFRDGVLTDTVEPRKLRRLARAVEREELSLPVAQRVVTQLIGEPTYTVEDAFRDSVEQIDFEHNLTTLAERVSHLLDVHGERGFQPSEATQAILRDLAERIARFLHEA